MSDALAPFDLPADASGAAAGGALETGGAWLESRSPIDGAVLGRVRQATLDDYESVLARLLTRFETWRRVPAPKRGEIVRQMGLALRHHRRALAELVTLEMGKIRAEAEGEVQEMIDIADFAVGLSRQLYGLTLQSERPAHTMLEQWFPLGAVGIISAFNFPVAVWAWNAFIAAVCGDVTLWKPSEKTPLCALAVQRIVDEVLAEHGCEGVMGLVIGPRESVGEALVRDRRLPLVSATGSCAMGRHVGTVVASRLGRSLLELGGNNALIVMQDADLDLALRAVLFGAVGTAGQRCTSTRRLLLEAPIADAFTARLRSAYAQVRIGDPREASTLMGPLIDRAAVLGMQQALRAAVDQGAEIIYGGRVLDERAGGCYVEPCLVRAPAGLPVARDETFAPILYVSAVADLDEAIAVQNDVPQGLSSALFTESFRAAQQFLSALGSDCGIANVNIGTSGAEIGGAFGGEKDTGGGREAGSDAWKAYMRRQTQTLNWSGELPLAQGIEFG